MGLTTSNQINHQSIDTTHLAVLSPPPVDEISFFWVFLMIVAFGAVGGIIDFLRHFRVRPTNLNKPTTNKHSDIGAVICYQDSRVTLIQFISLATIHSLSGTCGAFAVQLISISIGNFPGPHTVDLLLFSSICVISGFSGSIFLHKIS